MATPSPSIVALLKQGVQAQNAGNLPGAEAFYHHVLQLQPDQPDALQLLGLVASGKGDRRAAEALMRRSLHAAPRQPHVWNNLGNLLLDEGRGHEARECFDRALALQPRYADAHYNRARALHAAGQLPQARAALVSAQALAPSANSSMLQLQAQIESDGGDIDSALITLDRALQLAPDRAALHHNRATLLQRRHRYGEALASHDRALALGIDVADAHYNRGNSLQSLGRHDEAIAAYSRALVLDPTHRLALLDIARLRWRMGQADFDIDLRRATIARPESSLGHELLGQLLVRAERYAEAGVAYRQALLREPQSAALHDGLANCLVRTGEIEAGLAAHERAIELAPRDVQARVNHATSLLIARRPEVAAKAAQAACDLAPDNQNAWALLGLAWRLLGDPRETWLNDERRVVAVDLLPPSGFAEMASFNAALSRELESMHLDRQAPVDQTLRHGTQTLGDVFDQGHPLVDALKAQIAEAIGQYVADLPTDMSHPFLRRRSGAWRFSDSWSSRLADRGFHTNHVHPHGWISSAYYVSVPDCCADPLERQGWLRFGEPDFDIGIGNSGRLHVQPRVGRLVLFPSMFWHGTRPFSSNEPRLTIAFDVLP